MLNKPQLARPGVDPQALHVHGMGGPVSSKVIPVHQDAQAVGAHPVTGVPELFWGGKPSQDKRAVLFHGYAQWGTWQLESEILRGVWKVCNSSVDAAMENSLRLRNNGSNTTLWERLWSEHGATWREEEEALARSMRGGH